MTAYHPRFRRRGRIALATSIAAICLLGSGRAEFSITTGVGNTAQNFDALANSGTGLPFVNDPPGNADQPTLSGWSLFSGVGVPLTVYRADTGSTNAGSIYSYGDASATDRALGSIGTNATSSTGMAGGISFYYAFAATNNSAATLTSFTLGYDGEQWRNGGNANGASQSLTVEYGFGTAFDQVTWIAPGSAFDFTSPVTTPTAGAVAGNVSGAGGGLVSGLGGTVNGLNWSGGQTLWIRWVDVNDSNNDHGLAIDDFALSWAGAVIAPLYWDVNGATAGIGGTGTWNGSNTNWNPTLAGTGAPQAVDPGKRLVFGGTGGTITVDPAGVAANIGMEFEAPYTLNGGIITVGNISTISTNAPVTINAPIAGTSGLTKLGADTLTLTNAANTFAGAISINAGVLAVSGDTQLGAADNDVILSGGVLALGNSLALNVSRNISGAGGLRIPAGQTLTVAGTANLSSVDISSDSPTHTAGGTVALSAASNTVGNVTFSDPATITATTNLKINGNVTMAAAVAGPVAISAPTIDLMGGVQKFTVTDTPAAVDTTITGVLGGAGKLHKVGSGTLRLVSDNTAFTGGVRLGTAGATNEPGGKLIISDNGALGTSSPLDFQFNDGTLQADVALTGANALPVGISFGAGGQGEAVLTGSPMEFLGDLSLFKNAGTPEHKLRLDTDVTVRGFAVSQGTAGSSGLLLTGTRTLTFSGTATTPSTETLHVDGPTVVVNGSVTGATINVRSGTLKGVGSIGGVTTIGEGTGEDDAILAPGEGVGTLTAGGLTFSSDARLLLELDRQTATADKILADGPVDLGNSDVSFGLTILNSGTLTPGTAFTIIDNSNLGTTTGRFQGLTDDSTFVVSGLPFRIDYNGGPDFNDVVITYVPEPGSVGLLGLGVTFLGLRRRARRYAVTASLSLPSDRETSCNGDTRDISVHR